VLDPVIRDLGLQETTDELAKRIQSSVPLNTVIIELTVEDESPVRAAAIVNRLALSLTTTVEDIEKPFDGLSTPVKVTIIQDGRTPVTPDNPRPLLNMLIAIFGGLVIGVGLAILIENLDLRIRNHGDIEALTTASVLGGIGFDENAQENPLIVHTKPKSTRAEAFRQLRTNIQFVEAVEGRKSMIISSSVPSEGKSTTIANLAIAMADTGAKVLLIDCDFRKPKQHKYLGLEGAVGLTNHLIGQAKLEDVIQPWGKGKLSVLPAGQVPPNPSELLGSEKMRKLILDAEKKYDLVLIDTAPLLPVTDAAILSTMTGGVVVVVSVGKTTRPQLQGALSHIDTVGGKVLGFVMNKIPTKGADAYGYYSYGYKYGYKYGYQYGGTYGYGYGETNPYGEESEPNPKKKKK
jgi:capsular exopolysaccharide synthesis family protein